MIGEEVTRASITVRGAVQGVGFRPFVYRLAEELALHGWVKNSAFGVFIEVEGPQPAVHRFLLRLREEKPPLSFIQSLESRMLDPAGHDGFRILESDQGGEKSVIVLPDVATCPDCLREIFDPSDRRYLYPFTNCTNCGPRFSIVEALPYDRPNTTMKKFPMCARCRGEYEDPRDRRFHAQPNACSDCGPHVELWDRWGAVLCREGAAMEEAAGAIGAGRIVAVKGLGGFQLLVDARREEAVALLRKRKNREEKPLALMVPRPEDAETLVHLDDEERRLLLSPEAPIVLLRRRRGLEIAPSVAPGNPFLGVMLPYTPLHHILLRRLRFPVVATSGNLSDEPISTDERDAVERLGEIADLFLVHNRPIYRHVDDSIVRVMLGRELVLRRARGYAPLPVPLLRDTEEMVAVGAHLKNSVAVSRAGQVFLGQHIGDLETKESFLAFRRSIDSLLSLHEIRPKRAACDRHPDYLSTRHAESLPLPLTRVQHHHAHVLSCMAENELKAPLLGVAWDGTGYGTDGTVWGGEFLLPKGGGFRRAATFRTFPLPGGDRAIREPRRTALGVLYELFGGELFRRSDVAPVGAFSEEETAVLRKVLSRGVLTPRTSSVGRLFDGVASLLGIRQKIRFEGQAAMELEFAMGGISEEGSYPFELLHEGETLVVDWEAMIRAVLTEKKAGLENGVISARFHNTLAAIIVAVARRVGEERVVLTGGCFQNRYLTSRSVRALNDAGFQPYWHQRVPPNDGGIALGQIVAAAAGNREME